MVRLKTPQEIERLAAGGAILARILDELAGETIAGVTGRVLDARARELITEHGVTAAFLNYAPRGHKPFPAALCVSVNNAVVHGLPSKAEIQEGDIVGLDLGIVYQGLYLDSARTVGVGTISPAAATLLRVTSSALAAGISKARVGNTIGDIGAAIQRRVEGRGFSVVRQLVGHGVGYAVHEEPAVPNFGKPGTGLKLQAGLVIAIEPMVTTEDPTVTTGRDGWTVITQNGHLAAHEEHTVAVTPEGPRILTVSPTGG